MRASPCAGLGLRRDLLPRMLDGTQAAFDFIEAAPENWIGIGGRLGEQFARVAERHPLYCHGLSLNLGGPDPLDRSFLQRIGRFLDQYEAVWYSEHLSSCAVDGQLYELLPIPFTEEAIGTTAARIRQAQDILQRPVAVENVSYYTAPGAQMSELEFLLAVLEEADCALLLDVNNIVVNSVNNGYDAEQFLDSLPAQRIAYLHVAGHEREAEDLYIDTHGEAVQDEVWNLLARAYARFGPIPTLLERDFNFPAWQALCDEVNTIRRLQAACIDA